MLGGYRLRLQLLPQSLLVPLLPQQPEPTAIAVWSGAALKLGETETLRLCANLSPEAAVDRLPTTSTSADAQAVLDALQDTDHLRVHSRAAYSIDNLCARGTMILFRPAVTCEITLRSS